MPSYLTRRRRLIERQKRRAALQRRSCGPQCQICDCYPEQVRCIIQTDDDGRPVGRSFRPGAPEGFLAVLCPDCWDECAAEHPEVNALPTLEMQT